MFAMFNPFQYSLSARMKAALVLLRLTAGAYFFMAGYHKWLDHQFVAHFPSLLDGWAVSNPFFFYEDLLRHLIIPNAGLFAGIVTWAEMIVGGALILGLFTRWVSVGMIFLNLNFYLATQHTGLAAQGINLAFLMIGLTLFLSDVGLFLGLDQLMAYLREKFGPRSTLFVPTKVKSKNAKSKSAKSKSEKSKSGKKKPVPVKTGKRTWHDTTNDHDEDEDDDAYDYDDHEEDDDDDISYTPTKRLKHGKINPNQIQQAFGKLTRR